MSSMKIQNNKDIVLKALSDYFPHYRRVKKVALEEAYRRIDLPIGERLKLFYKTMDLEFRHFKDKVRPLDYSKVKLYRSKGHSCTNGVSGRVKDCGWKCIPRPGNLVFPHDVKVVGDSKGTKIENGTACIKMTVAGRGRNAGTISATFKYPPRGRYIQIGRTRIGNPFYHMMQQLFISDTQKLRDEIMNNDLTIKEIEELINSANH